MEGGTFGTFNQNARVSAAAERYNFYFDFAHFHSTDTPVTPSDLVPPGRSVQGDSYDNKTFSGRFGANLTDNFDIGVVTRYIDTSLRFTGDDVLGPESLKSTEADEQLFTRGTAHLVSFDGVLDQTVGFAYTKFNQRDFDPNPPSPLPSFFNGDRRKADWQADVKLRPGQILTFRAEHQRDEITTPLAEITNNAGMVQLQSSIGESFFNAVSVRYDSYDTFGAQPTFRIAPTFLIPETGSRLKGSVGTGFKAPTLAELFQNFPSFNFFGNPNLKPETSIGYDLGFEQTLLEKRVQLGATYFHNDIDNLITINDTGTSFQNVEKATTYGVESFLTYTPWEPLTLRADYTFLIARNDITDQELLRRPKHKASLDAAWHITEAAVLSATLLYVGPWVDVNRAGTMSGVPANGYTLVNLAGSYYLGNGLTAYARIDNLLNRHYQDPIGFLRPGLGVYAGLRVALDATRSRLIERWLMNIQTRPPRVTDPDGAMVEIFPLPSDEMSLEHLLCDLFEKHWEKITFGPLIQGAAWEIRAPHAPTHVGMLDGYLTVGFGPSHFHLCIGPHKGPSSNPTPETLARHRRTARAELYRRLDKSGAPVSWGLRLFNGEGEQQITVLLPNPFLSADGDKVLKIPEWSRLDLWDQLRARWLKQPEPDPFDRSGRGFSHG